MERNNLVHFAVLGDPVVHFASDAFPHLTLCGVATLHGRAWATPKVVDCMTCLVNASRLSVTVPKEFLYGASDEDSPD